MPGHVPAADDHGADHDAADDHLAASRGSRGSRTPTRRCAAAIANGNHSLTAAASAQRRRGATAGRTSWRRCRDVEAHRVERRRAPQREQALQRHVRGDREEDQHDQRLQVAARRRGSASCCRSRSASVIPKPNRKPPTSERQPRDPAAGVERLRQVDRPDDLQRRRRRRSRRRSRAPTSASGASRRSSRRRLIAPIVQKLTRVATAPNTAASTNAQPVTSAGRWIGVLHAANYRTRVDRLAAAAVGACRGHGRLTPFRRQRRSQRRCRPRPRDRRRTVQEPDALAMLDHDHLRACMRTQATQATAACALTLARWRSRSRSRAPPTPPWPSAASAASTS